MYDCNHLKLVENIYYGYAEIPNAIIERGIFNILKLDSLNGEIIDSIIFSLTSKQHHFKADGISSISSQILTDMFSREDRSIFMKQLKKDLLENEFLVVPINIANEIGFR